jgi:hypothetical protein
VVVAGLVPFHFPLEVPFLPTILGIISFFTRMRSGAEDGGGRDGLEEAGALNNYFMYKKEVRTDLDLIPGVAAA